jgi:cytochrome c oxidase assembly factor CtaG
VPGAYDAALAHRALHDLEHLCFFGAAVLFWWPLVHPAPRYRRAASAPARVVYLVLGAFQTGALGLALTLAPAVLYRSYAGDGGALDDQAWGGLIMWGVGGLVDMLAVLALVARSLGAGQRASLASSAAFTDGHSSSTMLK